MNDPLPRSTTYFLNSHKNVRACGGIFITVRVLYALGVYDLKYSSFLLRKVKLTVQSVTTNGMFQSSSLVV
jgi:hypothetical protein